MEENTIAIPEPERPEPVDLDQFEGMTPGPWIIKHGNIGPVITAEQVDDDGELMQTPHFMVDVWQTEKAVRHTDVDAHAIAAVPALIADLEATRRERDEALGLVKKYFDTYPWIGGANNEARALLRRMGRI